MGEEPTIRLVGFVGEPLVLTLAELRRRWEACGYTVNVLPEGEHRWRVELIRPGLPDEYTAGGGDSEVQAMMDATQWEFGRLPVEWQQLWAEG